MKKNQNRIQENGSPQILRSQEELERHLELMHDRCISRNLKAAGLGGVDNEEEFYGRLDANAQMETGESILLATIERIHDEEKQVRRKILN